MHCSTRLRYSFCNDNDNDIHDNAYDAAVVMTNSSRELKLKFYWDQFPRNFLADLLATSPTSS